MIDLMNGANYSSDSAPYFPHNKNLVGYIILVTLLFGEFEVLQQRRSGPDCKTITLTISKRNQIQRHLHTMQIPENIKLGKCEFKFLNINT